MHPRQTFFFGAVVLYIVSATAALALNLGRRFRFGVSLFGPVLSSPNGTSTSVSTIVLRVARLCATCRRPNTRLSLLNKLDVPMWFSNEYGALILTCFVALFASPANAQDIVKMCAGVEVRSIEVLADSGFSESRRKSIFLPPGPSPTIDVMPPQKKKAAPEKTQRYVTVMARGPVLGSMDSQKITTDFSCTVNGVLLTATITRSANYAGAVQKNAAWRPQLRALLVLHQSEVALQTVWKMRLSTGSEVREAETPSYATQKYPIIITTTVRVPANQE